ncbi:MAG: STAS domain-containing protein [Candidatus Marinimicrobia bacterium]|nr:STAS domain-containing protein [Candidatus Neomarinimicrobiota bacterium]
MKFETEIVNDTLVVRVQNTTFDIRGVKAFKRDIFMAIAESDFKNIMINMENVRMVDSTGLGGLLFAKRQATIKGGECYLVKPQQKIASLIKISKLDEVFIIVDDEKAVLKD